MRKNSPKAFSLIELSIVILIIGVIVAGITQSSRLVAQMRLYSARSQTQSSDVGSIKGLVTWLETTSDKSFDDADAVDGAGITNWYDINPQSTLKNNAQQSSGTANLHPIYKANCINSLPCLQFDGSNAYIDTLQTIGTTTEISIFAVMSPRVAAANTEYALVSTHGSWTSNASFTFKHWGSVTGTSAVEYQLPNSVSIRSPNISAGKNYVVDTVDDNTNGTTYSNKTGGSASSTASTKTIGLLNIGAWYNGTARVRYFDGNVGEIIIFNRALKTEERQAVENYLAKKWVIK